MHAERGVGDGPEEIPRPGRGREAVAPRPDRQEDLADHVLGRRPAEAADVPGQPHGLRVIRGEQVDDVFPGDDAVDRDALGAALTLEVAAPGMMLAPIPMAVRASCDRRRSSVCLPSPSVRRTRGRVPRGTTARARRGGSGRCRTAWARRSDRVPRPGARRPAHNTRALASADGGDRRRQSRQVLLHANLVDRQEAGPEARFVGAVARGRVLTRRPADVLRALPETRRMYRLLLEELAALARAESAGLDESIVDQTMKALDSAAPGALTSLYYDLVHGKRHGIPTPMLFAAYALLRPYRDGSPASA
jgi:hypothetical protein